MNSSILRPAFTQRLGQKLAEGASILLTGTEAQGSTRLLDDLSTFDMHLISIDFHTISSFTQFMETWSEQLFLPEKEEDPTLIVEAMKIQGGNWWFLWNHLSEIPLKNGQQKELMISALQDISLVPTLGFLGVSENSAGLEDWPLEEQKLPPLSYSRVKEEFHRHWPEKQLPQKIINKAFSHSHPYLFTQFLILKLQDQMPNHESMEDKLVKWEIEFNDQIGIATLSINKTPLTWWQRFFRLFREK